MLSYADARQILEGYKCTAMTSHPSARWHRQDIGVFYIRIVNGQVSEAEIRLIEHDLIRGVGAPNN